VGGLNEECVCASMTQGVWGHAPHWKWNTLRSLPIPLLGSKSCYNLVLLTFWEKILSKESGGMVFTQRTISEAISCSRLP